ncbi:hypothetical protein GmRootV59_04100 [Variovorax sp. V59]
MVRRMFFSTEAGISMEAFPVHRTSDGNRKGYVQGTIRFMGKITYDPCMTPGTRCAGRSLTQTA